MVNATSNIEDLTQDEEQTVFNEMDILNLHTPRKKRKKHHSTNSNKKKHSDRDLHNSKSVHVNISTNNDTNSNSVDVIQPENSNISQSSVDSVKETNILVKNRKQHHSTKSNKKKHSDRDLHNSESVHVNVSINNDTNSNSVDVIHQENSDTCLNSDNSVIDSSNLDKNKIRTVSLHQPGPSSKKPIFNDRTTCDIVLRGSGSETEDNADDFNYFQGYNQYIDSYMEKEFLNFDIPPLHEKESVSLPSKEMLDYWKSRNILINCGKWSCIEILTLKKNYLDYITKYNVSDPFFLLGLGQKHRSKESTEFLKNTRFYVQLGKDLNNRTLRSIYVKARSLFDPFRKQDPAKTDEIDYIIEKQRQIGRKWTRIGKKMKRSGENCKQVFRWNDKDVKKGKWSQDEIDALMLALEKVTGLSDYSDYSQIKNIPWDKVAELVPNKNFSQCRQFWALHLTWKKDIIGRKKWKRSSMAKLIYILKSDYYVKDEVKLDWEKIQKSFENVSPSTFYLRKKWSYLKSRVPLEENKTYRSIIDFLYDKYNERIQRFLSNEVNM